MLNKEEPSPSLPAIMFEMEYLLMTREDLTMMME
jgi:hypothetical protein